MTTEFENLDLTEDVVNFVFLCQKYGARNVLLMIRQCDRSMFEELKTQIDRLDLPALLVSRFPNARSM